MRTIEHCPICQGPPRSAWPALVAPFIAEYALHSPVSTCWLNQCGECGLRFFDSRFEEPELARLYAGYRGPGYFQARHRMEFWYTKHHNEDSETGSAVAAARKRALLEALQTRLDPASLHRVLDFGGDSGQLLPKGLGQERHVFEISDAVPVAGVLKISDETLLQPGSYDLVILSHVLEHTPDPVALLGKAVSLLRTGGWLYVEVPWERYGLGLQGKGPAYAGYLKWLARHPRLLRILDFYSTGFRSLLNTVPPFGFSKLHEHINFFDERSLALGCARAGLEVSACGRSRLPREAHGVEILFALARLP